MDYASPSWQVQGYFIYVCMHVENDNIYRLIPIKPIGLLVGQGRGGGEYLKLTKRPCAVSGRRKPTEVPSGPMVVLNMRLKGKGSLRGFCVVGDNVLYCLRSWPNSSCETESACLCDGDRGGGRGGRRSTLVIVMKESILI